MSSLIPLVCHQGQCWADCSVLPLLDAIQAALPELLEETDLVSLLADWDLTRPLEATASWWATSLCVSSLSKDRHSLLMAFQLWGWPPTCTGYMLVHRWWKGMSLMKVFSLYLADSDWRLPVYVRENVAITKPGLAEPKTVKESINQLRIYNICKQASIMRFKIRFYQICNNNKFDGKFLK